MRLAWKVSTTFKKSIISKEMITNSIKTIFCYFRRNCRFSWPNALGFAIGIGSCTMIFLLASLPSHRDGQLSCQGDTYQKNTVCRSSDHPKDGGSPAIVKGLPPLLVIGKQLLGWSSWPPAVWWMMNGPSRRDHCPINRVAPGVTMFMWIFRSANSLAATRAIVFTADFDAE